MKPPRLGKQVVFPGRVDEVPIRGAFQQGHKACPCLGNRRSGALALSVGFFPPPSPLLQAKLEEALALATDFQNSLQDFINWLTLAEQSLNIVPPPSLILSAVLAQIDEHKVRRTASWGGGSNCGT